MYYSEAYLKDLLEKCIVFVGRLSPCLDNEEW